MALLNFNCLFMFLTWNIETPESIWSHISEVCVQAWKSSGLWNAAVVFSTFYDNNVGTNSVAEVGFWVSMRGKAENVASAACNFCLTCCKIPAWSQGILAGFAQQLQEGNKLQLHKSHIKCHIKMWESINLSSKVSISRWFQIFVGLVMWDWAEDNMLRHAWAKMYFCRHYFKKLIKIIDCCVTELIALWFPLHFVYSSPAPQDYGAHIFTPASYKTLTSSKILHVLTQTYFV